MPLSLRQLEQDRETILVIGMKKIAINVETLKLADKYNSARVLRDIIQACRATPAQVAQFGYSSL